MNALATSSSSALSCAPGDQWIHAKVCIPSLKQCLSLVIAARVTHLDRVSLFAEVSGGKNK